MFGDKKAGRTVLLLDIESGSVGSALLNLSKKSGPYLYGYNRLQAPLQQARSSESLFAALNKTLDQSLLQTAEVAARMRTHSPHLGSVEHIAVFFSAPWGTPDLTAGKPVFGSGLIEHIKNSLNNYFGEARASFHTSADALAFNAHKFTSSPDVLLAALRGELMEMLLFTDARVVAYGTAPIGTHTILRTLKAHGGLSEHESRSLLKLLEHGDQSYEPLIASGEHARKEFANAAALVLQHGTPTSIVLMGEQPLADWFAKRIAEEESLAALFPENTTVEALRQHYFGAPLATSAISDPFLLAEAAYVDARASL